MNIAGRMRTVAIEKKRIKRMYLRIRPDGTLYVSCPLHTPDLQIQRFLMEKEDWIRKAESKVQKQTVYNNPALYGRVYWLGEEMPVQYVHAVRSKVEIIDGTMIMHLKTMDEESAAKLFQAYAAKEIKRMLEQLRTEWDTRICDVYRIPRPVIRTRTMKTRWGVCYPDKHTITINTRLIHYPLHCLRYVLLHEYVHFLVRNHSSAFYAQIAAYMPDYRRSIRTLKGQ
jgi:predicted metal-dependent hydrolase